jgi:hypothetical protein
LKIRKLQATALHDPQPTALFFQFVTESGGRERRQGKETDTAAKSPSGNSTRCIVISDVSVTPRNTPRRKT